MCKSVRGDRRICTRKRCIERQRMRRKRAAPRDLLILEEAITIRYARGCAFAERSSLRQVSSNRRIPRGSILIPVRDFKYQRAGTIVADQAPARCFPQLAGNLGNWRAPRASRDQSTAFGIPRHRCNPISEYRYIGSEFQPPERRPKKLASIAHDTRLSIRSAKGKLPLHDRKW